MAARRVTIALAPVVAALAMLVGALHLGGAIGSGALVVTPPIVTWGLPVATAITLLAGALCLGCLALVCFALPFEGAAFERAMSLSTAAAVVWTAGSGAVLLLTYASIDFTAYDDLSTAGTKLGLFVTQVEVGANLAWVLCLAAATTILTAAFRSRAGVLVAMIFAFATDFPLAQNGHAAGSTEHNLAVSSQLLHLWGVSVWVGGLLALGIVAPSLGRMLRDVAERYSTLALGSFVVVAFSGVLSAVLRVTTLAQLATGYGALLLLKSTALVVLCALGAVQRRRILSRGDWGATGRPRLFLRMVLGELVVMGAAIGLAVALSESPPPTVQAPYDSSPAAILTGDALPPELTAMTLLTQWSLDPLWLTIGIGALGFYLAGVRRLHRRGDTWNIGRTVSWTAGCLVLLLVTNGGANRYQDYMFSVHMTVHMVLTMVIPVLLVPAAPITLLARAVRPRHDGSWGMREWGLWAVHTPWARFFAHPIVAAVVFAVSLWVFYYTPILEWAVSTHVGHEWMTVHFLLTGYLFVFSLVGIDPGPRRPAYPIRMLILLATMAFHAFFGVSIMMSKGLFAASWFGAMGRTWGPDPLTDQHIGGGIAWSIGEIPTVALALVVAILWARSDERIQRRLDRSEQRSGDAELHAYNAMLASLSEGRGGKDVGEKARGDAGRQPR